MKTKLTPVRMPGGKSNALKFLDKYLIKDFAEYREPFFGGGSVGLYLMQFNKDADYWINDLFYPVYCFWKVLYEQPEKMSNWILKVKTQETVPNDIVVKGIPSKSAGLAREIHVWCRKRIEKTISEKDEFGTACLWYILNKTSYSGMSMIGSFAPLAWDQNFTINCINNLPKTSELMHSVKSLKITNLNYTELLGNDGNDVFIFLDPPYKIPHNLYGDKGDMHEGFYHLEFVCKALECKHNWMITYNEDPDLIQWFGKDKRQILWDLQYTMKAAKRDGQKGSEITGKSGKKGKELLIMNYPDYGSKDISLLTGNNNLSHASKA